MADLSQWLVAVVEVVEELWSPSSPKSKRAALERSMAVERERLLREIEVAEGYRSSVWGSQQ